jgi:hypothetical protein
MFFTEISVVYVYWIQFPDKSDTRCPNEQKIHLGTVRDWYQAVRDAAGFTPSSRDKEK